MANVKISEMTPDGSVGGSELLPVSDAGSPKSVTVDNIKDYIVDAIEAISAAESVSGSDGIFVLQGGVLKPADIDLVAQHAIDTIWGKDAEASPDSADILALKDGGTTEKTVTLALLAEYVRATIEAAILDISNLSDGSGALTGTDKMLVTQGTTGKYVTLTDVSNAIYAALKTYVAALGAVTTSLTDDVFYCIQGGTEKKVTLAEIATYIGALYTVPSETTANGIPQWTNATGGLKNGLTLVTAVGAEGDDSSVPSEQAVRESMSTLVYDQADIGEALADDDTIVVDDGAAGTTQRKSAISRLWTYILAKIVAETDVSASGWVVDEDDLSSDLDTKVPTQQSVKSYVDSAVAGGAWDGAIADIDLDGGTDIGANLVDGDLVLVDDGAGGTNRKSAVSRLWTYILAKIVAVTDVSTYGWVIDEDTLASSLDTKVPTQQSVKEYVDNAVFGGAWDGDIADIDLDGGTDIGADLADADLLLVDDEAGGTNRKSAVSRVWTYVTQKIQGLSAKAAPVAADILTVQDSEDSNNLKEVTLANLQTLDRYNTIWVPASAMTPSITAGASAETIEYGTEDVTHDVLAFAGDTADESAEFNIVMPEDWDRGTLKAKLFWTNGHAEANPNEWIQFGLGCRSLGNDDALDADPLTTYQNMADQLIADDDLHISSASAAITPAGSADLGDILHFKLTRDYDFNGGGTAMDVDCYVFGVLIQYKMNNIVAAW